MAQPCKVFSYTNVGTEKGVLANIASAAQAGGWTVDKNAVDADGELYLHSAGGGNRRLFFSLRLLQAHDNAERFLLAVHGNTGFDASAAWDAQPGRFTERLAHGYCSRTTGKPIWLRTPGKYSITSNPGKFLASAVGSLTQPLFNHGQVVAQYRIARAQQEEAALGFQQTLLNAGSEVNDALTAYQTSQGKKLLLDKQVASLQTALRSTSLLMEHGNTTYLEVLTARQTLLSAQLSQTANHFTEIQSLINLFQALGGGQN